MNELKNRGVEDILLAVVDGLKGGAPSLALPSAVADGTFGKLAQGSFERSSME
jgi:transposase-like protein